MIVEYLNLNKLNLSKREAISILWMLSYVFIKKHFSVEGRMLYTKELGTWYPDLSYNGSKIKLIDKIKKFYQYEMEEGSQVSLLDEIHEKLYDLQNDN